MSSSPRSDPEQVVRTYFRRLLVERDLTVCDELLSSDYVDHDAPAGTPPGPAAIRAYVEILLADHPDLRFEVEDLVAQGRTVAVRATWRGTHKETRRPMRQGGLVFIDVGEHGRITERWSAYLDLDS
jgi:ketosteroid isomerase-like protein